MRESRPRVHIIGQQPEAPSAQVVEVPQSKRDEAINIVGNTLDEQRARGLRFGRLIAGNVIGSTSLTYVLLLEALEAAGCRIIGVGSMVIPGDNGQAVELASITFRCPESLFTGVNPT